MNAARDAVNLANTRNESCGVADIDLVAGFNLVSMDWICLVLKAKGMTPANISRFSNMYKEAVIRVVVNGEIGNAVKIKRCVRQGSPLAMLEFLYELISKIPYIENYI